MKIVDAQIHLWGSGLPSNMAHWQVTSFTAAEAIGMMDEAGVDAAVIHPPPWDPGSHELAFKAVRDYQGIVGVEVTVDRWIKEVGVGEGQRVYAAIPLGWR